MMNPVIVHADGTDCRHQGPPQATALDKDGPRCAGGMLVTHVWFNGRLLTIAEAAEVFMRFAAALGRAMQPLSAAFAEFARKLNDDPAIRAIAAAAGEHRSPE